MYALTEKEVRQIEREAFKSQTFSEEKMIENAGRAIALLIRDHLPGRKNVLVLAGKGRNGGDGYVAARLLEKWDYNVKAYTSGTFLEYENPGQRALASLGFSPNHLDNEHLMEMEKDLAAADIVIDALYSFESSEEPTVAEIEAIRMINRNRKVHDIVVVSTDVPSGLNAETGLAIENAIEADYTLAFTCPKIGCLIKDGPYHCGKILSANVGIDDKIVHQFGNYRIITKNKSRIFLPKRRHIAHKHTTGRVLVVAGSRGMSGAAYLASKAALLAGAGLVKVAVPNSLVSVMEEKTTEVMTVGLPETEAGAISTEAAAKVIQLSNGFDTVVIGPGLGSSEETAAAVQRMLREIEVPVVLDADGLNAIIGEVDILRSRASRTIITPHAGEFGRLIGKSSEEVLYSNLELSQEFANAFETIVVLKGIYTVIAGKDQPLYFNIAGNSGLASAGTGDVLTGIIAGLTAQKVITENKDLRTLLSESAATGVYVQAATADIVAAERSEYSLTAGDLLENMHLVLKDLSVR